MKFNLFNNLTENTAEDWSNKVDLSKGITLTYNHGSYGQTNYMKFANEDNEDAESFTISDSTLPFEYTAVETSVDRIDETYTYYPSAGGNHTVAKARIFDTEDRLSQPDENLGNHYSSQGWLQKIESENPYFVRIATTTPTAGTHRLSYIGDDDNLASPELLSRPDIDTAIPLATNSNINFAYYNANYYNNITTMLQDVKKIVCYLDLSAVDIYNLDFNTPKYLFNDRMNDNFYLTQVSNFKAGRLTKCEFIRI